MGIRLLRWWESKPPRHQIMILLPTMLVALLALHLIFFANLSVGRSIMYAVMEAVPLTLLFVLVTQAEIARRRDAEGDPNLDQLP